MFPNQWRLIILLSLVVGNLPGQAGGIPPIRQFKPNEYRARNQNWCIGQTSDRRIWVANSGGLLEFDGVDWQLHPFPNQQPVRTLTIAPDDKIFVGGFAEFGYWHQTGQDLQYTSLSQREANDQEFWHTVLHDSTVFTQSFAEMYAYTNGQRQRLDIPGTILFARSTTDQLFLPVIAQGIYRYQQNGSFQLLPGTEPTGEAEVRGILTQEDGLLIATERLGLLHWRAGALRPWDIPLAATIQEQTINQMVRLQNGDLAIGTRLGGVYILQPDGKLRLHLDESNGLQDNNIYAIFEDQDQNLWLGLDRGIDLVLMNHPLRFAGQESGSVYTAIEFAGNFYIGTNRGLFRRPLEQPNEPFQLVPGSQGRIRSLSIANGILLVAHNSGIAQIRETRWESIFQRTGSSQFLEIPDQPNYRLVATFTGLVRLVYEPRKGWRALQRLDGILAPLRQITWDPEGWLLAIHENRGLYRVQLSPNSNRILRVTRPDTNWTLPSLYNFSLTRQRDRLILQTPRSSYHLVGDSLLPASSQSGPPFTPGRRAQCLDGKHWVEISLDSIIYYGQHRNAFAARSSSFRPRVSTLSNGAILFGLEEGFATFCPDREGQQQPPTPEPQITRMEVIERNGETKVFSTKSNEPIKLSYRKNRLRFWFCQTRYDQAPSFSYRLIGDSKQWSIPSKRNFLVVNGLKSGYYRLELKSPNGTVADTWRFYIVPPWYFSTLAWICYVLLAVIIGLLLNRYLQHRLYRQRIQLEQERERQLHEERIRLRNEQLQADNLRKSKELANTTFNLVTKNEILLELKDALGQVRGKGVDRLRHLIDKHQRNTREDAVFDEHFNEVHEAFFRRLKVAYPNLSPGDLRLAAYLKMNLSSKEIAPLLRISLRGVENKRYRLRKKMNLPAEEPLQDFFLKF